LGLWIQGGLVLGNAETMQTASETARVEPDTGCGQKAQSGRVMWGSVLIQRVAVIENIIILHRLDDFNSCSKEFIFITTLIIFLFAYFLDMP
jgi:hypothetical protein